MSDLISRADAIKAIEELPNAYNGWSDTYDKACIIGVLEEVPSADRPIGKWIEEIAGNGWNEWVNLTCDQCGAKFEKAGVWLYCPNCGARINGESK